MRIHHLNCGSMATPGGTIVCHVLLCETADSLVLVDTGFGLEDVRDPKRRLGPSARLLGAELDESETAIRQVEALGFAAEDVRDIVITHFDLDHVGGLSDFPHARVHVSETEWDAVQKPTRRERLRYRRSQLSHNPTVLTYAADGEPWRGLPAARPLDGLGTDFALVPVVGHSRGHAAIAVDAGADGWLLHAGDAYFHPSALGKASKLNRRGAFFTGFEYLVAADPRRMRDGHRTLAALPSDITVFSAHDRDEFARLRSRSGNRT
ncbi:MAG: MBL fold metallo-hydrolase [Mycobacterium sp.]|nr:MAG: MBL fold metallo-hydrolase [Mycobacterium sp.]HQD97586.1 MBL fold metallo-hydrolase [Propionicimonas sp.]